ncbi:G-PROTEIN-RECEP-F3-4 domain-containing protein [Aphelenchoides besseyi]|nr:G-PROTEIN-RECEP-F3-4 domain-containing protein [Aphelenchoides besseyi]
MHIIFLLIFIFPFKVCGQQFASPISTGGDYHRVIDQLAKALSSRAQSVGNVTGLLNRVLEGQQRLNSSNGIRSSWPNEAIYHVAKPLYRSSVVNNSSEQIAERSDSSMDKSTETETAHTRVTVPSQRLLNDILVVRSSRRLYILALIPVHESLNTNGYECGQIDVNAMVRLGAFLTALDEINQRVLEPDLNLGVVVVDTCSSDLRTLANLYELFTGTNIDKSDIVSVILDDDNYFPITNQYLNHLNLPIVRTFFSHQQSHMSISMLPSITQPVEAILDLLQFTQSTCVSVIHDESYVDFVRGLSELAFERYMCIDKVVTANSTDGIIGQQRVVRSLLLSEARVILVLYTERSWIDFAKALNEEMVISGRFIFASLYSSRWKTSRVYTEIWPKFDQLLLSVKYKLHRNITYLNKLNAEFAHLPFPVQWLRQFWTTAFKCHFIGEQFFGEQFSRICPSQQNLDLTTISPDMNVAPISFAVYSVAQSLRRLVEQKCPGALVRSLTDCLSEPYDKLVQLIQTASFPHPFATGGQFSINSTDGFAKAELMLNRVYMNQGSLVNEELGVWDSEGGLTYTANKHLFVEDRDGSRIQVISQCPKSSCWGASAVKRTSRNTPHFIDSLFNVNTFMFSCVSICWTFVCLMCTYQKMISSTNDPFWACSSVSFVGAALTALMSTLFVMTPSEPTCALRLNTYSFCLLFVTAPVFVRVFNSWNFHAVSLKGEIVGNNRPMPPSFHFWSSIEIICVQIFLLAQWSFFETLDQLEFSQYDSQFAWRCLGGAQSEYVLIRSYAFVGVICLLMFCCALFRCTNRDIHAALLALNTFAINGILWYLTPQLNFLFRDYLVTALLLWYSVSAVLTNYCFSPKYPIIELASTTLSDTSYNNKRGTLLRKTQIAQEQQQKSQGTNIDFQFDRSTLHKPTTLPKASLQSVR